MRVRLLSVGSRGDIQPFVALGVGLQARGHDVRVVAPENFAGFVQEHGLDFGAITVDYQAMAESDEVKAVMTNPLKAIPHMRQTFLPVLRTVMADSWQHTQDADALVYHPKVLAGLHIAEKLGVPPFLTLMIPGFFPTSAFANPLTPNVPGFMNRASHGATGPAATLPFKGIINDFRTETLGLRKIGGTIDETQTRDGQPVHSFFPISPSVVPKPDDWPAHAHIPGYWFLDARDDWQPPTDLVAFIEGGDPPVYIGFGSLSGENPEETTRMVLDAIERAGVRAILAKGWGGLLAGDAGERTFLIDAAPHAWLFPRMAGVVHHGGAGTTAAGLRAGKPTFIISYFGDQPFWGKRVTELGVGPQTVKRKHLTTDSLTAALTQMVSDQAMCERAEALGEQIRAEDGIGNAIAVIERVAG